MQITCTSGSLLKFHSIEMCHCLGALIHQQFSCLNQDKCALINKLIPSCPRIAGSRNLLDIDLASGSIWEGNWDHQERAFYDQSQLPIISTPLPGFFGCCKIVRSITCGCTICRRNSTRPQPQKLGQLPIERITPGPVFDKVGVDYAGPVYIKYGYVCKPTIVKAYLFPCRSRLSTSN